jgi:hypothetical protein
MLKKIYRSLRFASCCAIFSSLQEVFEIFVVADETGPQRQDGCACSRCIHLLSRGYIHLR